MATLKDTFSTITGWAKDIVSLGFALALVFLVVDILFPETTGIVGNVSDLVHSFTDEGLVGLITFIIFLTVYRS
jgi:hypothetical protein|tara:strand:- start:519 stop:740 length:222 start_codon:yes stop_codon:yes gene_type:complete